MQVEGDADAFAKTRKGGARVRSFAADPSIYPCQLSSPTQSQAQAAVKAAENAWGSSSLTVLEAEDRLSVACEKGVTDDNVLLKLRVAFQVNREEVLSLGGGAFGVE